MDNFLNESGLTRVLNKIKAAFVSKTELANKEDKMTIEAIASPGATLTAEVDKYYTMTNVGTLAITLPTMTDATKVKTIVFYISTNSAPAVTFTSTHTVLYSDGFQIDADSTYEINALWNGIAWVVAGVTIITNP